MPSHTMFSILVFAALCASCLAQKDKSGVLHYSFSRSVGGAAGSSFSTEGEGKITGVRVWEVSGSYITGIQLRYDYIWTARVGRAFGRVNELNLFDNESIIQVSGKYYTNYIYQLIFVTSRGRSLIVGQPTRTSFNFHPKHEDAGLIMLSGRSNTAGITALAAHWGSHYINQGNSTDVS
ncbi:zymogen granule membrane protein 16-like [Symphorus nematophorus]